MFLLHLGQTLLLSNPMDAPDASTTLTGTMTRLRVIAAAVAVAISPALAAAQTPQQLADLDLEDLMRISVQRVFGASERLQPVTEAPSAVTIVTADEIRRYGYRTLGEILAGVRGFFVSNDRNYSYLGARGFGRPGDYNTRVLLLVNGHRTNDNVFDQAYIGAELGIDVAMFDRVEIIRGPASSLYGTSAFFAVVNVVTRSGASMKGASIEADAGTLGTQLARASFGRELAGGADVALSGTYERSSGVGNLYFPAFDTPGTSGGVAQNLDGEDVGEL
jgi:outer membrane cobalamin receptor